MDKIALSIAVLSALFAALAALANLQQARKTSHANEVQVYLGLSDHYGSQEMRTAISSLASFWRDNKENVSEAFRLEVENNPENASKLRGYCRLISSYFVDAARLYEAGFISQKLFKLLISHPGLNVFYEVAVPINLTKNIHHNSGKYISMLKEAVPRHGEGIF